ncbi:MAG: ABC transporter ATP-binding protein [Peptococcaceae bacterium]|jgi:simple sugar transport system ATP-binding protein|nr:ABC transporter ATP-binding protein [Peptococcaceae bacterium]
MRNIEYAVEMTDVCKNYGLVQANKDINLKVVKGEIHAIVGENGAGKTTLTNILYGMITPSSGSVAINGQPVRIPSPKAAIALGIGMVHQHFKLVPNFTVAENICLGHEPIKSLRRVDKKRMLEHTREISERYGLVVEPEKRVRDLSVGLLQRVEILKALSRGAEILILDEPTAVLTPLECRDLFKVLRGMSGQGKTVLLITHKLKEVMEVSHHITVLRRGITMGTLETSDTDERRLAGLMMGKEADFVPLEKKPRREDKTAFLIRGLQVRDNFNIVKLKGISLEVMAGEILTVAGVEGNGQTELVEALMGFARIEAGQVLVDGEDIARRNARGRRERCSFIPEDRMKTGLNLDGSVHDNLIAGRQRSPEIKRGPFFDYRKSSRLAEDLVRKFNIKTAGLDIEVSSLSGGNQQKIVVAREMSFGNKVLVVAQPSRGVDIGATNFIHEQLTAARNAGCAILLISTDLDEVYALSDRIQVLFDGEIVGSFTPDSLSQQEIGLYMTGVNRCSATPEDAARPTAAPNKDSGGCEAAHEDIP